ncbi:QcrA and Rieske domain-containing protein [Anaeromyxobacter oryzae]|uniref:Rieske domain-containing protein n=1 Tax=Anaeromyxobacter oryzae TaxID=2918170 RepID=A0ABN6MPX0_9BACT|nr:Rieske 2Fe-2S domain-containing protein [Anaeromyxobacter oryzae]BDG03056.1 hypothetical protein AMOR_20520 [Anaeromyxobacter oryzae]
MTLSRRQLLFRAAAATGAAAVSAALPGCAPDIGPAPSVDVPAPVDGKITIPLATAPQLRAEGGAIIARPQGAGPVLVVHVPTVGSYASTTAICTHLGCPLGFEDTEIVCPCHGSRFGLDGSVHHPPARGALATYEATLDVTRDAVVVDLTAGDPGFPALVNGTVVFPLADFPALASPGGTVTGRPQGYGRPITVIALPAGGHAALDSVCAHLGCTVAYHSDVNEMICPCHGSTYLPDGTLVRGPASHGLRAFTTTADATAVTVAIPG